MFTANETAIIDQALNILEKSLKREDLMATEPTAAANYLQLKIGTCERENFAILFLDNKHQLIKFDVLFKGTIDSAAIYPREVVKAALKANAAAVILGHNHPSGNTEPSNADKQITKRLAEALNIVEIKVLDHIVVSPTGFTSLAQRGLM